MRIRTFVAPLLAAGASAVAIAFAPLAEAAPTCTSSGLASICQSPGNAQVSATPPPIEYQPVYPFYGGYGQLFHHGGRHNRNG